MLNKILIFLISLSFTFAVYNVGQTVSSSDQNIELYDCDTSSEAYQFCNSFNTEDDCEIFDECTWTSNNSSGNYCKSQTKLADWNGSINGGDYHVIWLEMSASW